ncbi:MAG: hypothetical protein K2X91_13780 [Thermoleophilia bacterium]|nr:hypothetical protein [Thermoleophilia bacterium]
MPFDAFDNVSIGPELQKLRSLLVMIDAGMDVLVDLKVPKRLAGPLGKIFAAASRAAAVVEHLLQLEPELRQRPMSDGEWARLLDRQLRRGFSDQAALAYCLGSEFPYDGSAEGFAFAVELAAEFGGPDAATEAPDTLRSSLGLPPTDDEPAPAG